MIWVPATPMNEYTKGVQECRGALYVRPQGEDKLRRYERIFTVKSPKSPFFVIPANPGSGPGQAPESSTFIELQKTWTPFFNGVTTFYETVIAVRNKSNSAIFI